MRTHSAPNPLGHKELPIVERTPRRISFSETKERVSFRRLSITSQNPDVQVNVDASISEDGNAPTVARTQPDMVDVEALKLDELKSLEGGRHVCRLVGEALRAEQAKAHLHAQKKPLALNFAVPFIVYSLRDHDVPLSTRKRLAYKYGAAGFAADPKQLLQQFQHVFGADEGDGEDDQKKN